MVKDKGLDLFIFLLLFEFDFIHVNLRICLEPLLYNSAKVLGQALHRTSG